METAAILAIGCCGILAVLVVGLVGLLGVLGVIQRVLELTMELDGDKGQMGPQQVPEGEEGE